MTRRTIDVQKVLMAYHEAAQLTIFDTNGGIIAARTHADSRKGPYRAKRREGEFNTYQDSVCFYY